MRKMILACWMLTSVITLSAQTNEKEYYRHEISGSVGIASLSGDRWDDFRDQMENRFALSFRHGYVHSTTPIGARMGLRYMYYFNKHIAIGGQFSYFSGSLSYDHYSKKETVAISPDVFRIEEREYDNPPSIRAKSFSIMPAVKWNYSRCFYARGGIGMQHRAYSFDATAIDASTSSPVKDSYWLFAYQIVPLGVELALPGDEMSKLLFNHASPVRFHVELGYGMEGILNVGVAYKFGKQK